MEKWDLMKALKASENLLNEGINRRKKKKRDQELPDYLFNDRPLVIKVAKKSSDLVTCFNKNTITNTNSSTRIIETLPDQPHKNLSKSVGKTKPSGLALLQSIKRPQIILTARENEEERNINPNIKRNNNHSIFPPIMNIPNLEEQSPSRMKQKINSAKTNEIMIAVNAEIENKNSPRKKTVETVLKLNSDGTICISNENNNNTIENNYNYGYSSTNLSIGQGSKEKTNSFLISNNLNFNRQSIKKPSYYSNNKNNVAKLNDIGNTSPFLQKKDINYNNILSNANNIISNSLSPHKYHLKLINPNHLSSSSNNNNVISNHHQNDESPIVKLGIISTTPNLNRNKDTKLLLKYSPYKITTLVRSGAKILMEFIKSIKITS